MRVVIVGAGLAGCAAAYMLRKAGAQPVIYEMGETVAPGASGNSVGLYNPRLSAEPGFYSEAFPLALEVFAGLSDVGWNKCGALHLMTDEKRTTRFRQAAANWQGVRMEIVSAARASEIAGVKIRHEALWLPDSGTISPKKLCERYAEGVEIHFGEHVEKIDADAVIWAAGMETQGLPLKAVRGQMTLAQPSEESAKLKTNLCYGGYCSPVVDGTHALGATFQRWLDHSQIIEQDDENNISKLDNVAPDLAERLQVVGHRAAVRTTSPDHFPVIGAMRDNIYVSTAHGSHGILSSLAAAHILSVMIMKKPQRFSAGTLEKISPARFGTGLVGKLH